MRCSNCGWDNPDSVAHCQKCGQALVFSVHHSQENTLSGKACPACSYPLSTLSRVCPWCGTPVAGFESAPKPEKPVREPKVTMLQADFPVFQPEPRQEEASAPVPETSAPVQAPPAPRWKPTVADIAQTLADDSGEVFRLIPVKGGLVASIELRLGEAVEIDGKRYLFTK